MVTSPWRERREVWREKRKVRIFGKGKCKLIANCANFWQVKVWIHRQSRDNGDVTSVSISLSLSVSLSLSHQKYLTHNIGSASALPIIGASLSEPHSYVLTRTFAIRDIYIYIYKSSVRPLGFVPATIQPKSRANPVLRLCLPLALDWRWFRLERMPVQKPCFFFLFLHHLHRVFSCPLRRTRSGFFRQAFCLSLPFFHAHWEIDDWRPEFRFLLWWPLIDWLLSVVFGKGERKHRENNQREEWNPQRRNGRVWTLGRHHNFRLLSTGPCLHCVTVHCLASWQVARGLWHLLEKARLRFHRRKRSVPSKARPTMLAFPSI